MQNGGFNVRRSPPVVAKLPNSERWAVFNMQDTPLWDKTFATHYDAMTALAEWRVKQSLEKAALEDMR